MRKNPYSGKLIVFEGIDGSGKTTQAGILASRLDPNCVLTSEPTKDSVFGKFLRTALTSNIESEIIKSARTLLQNRSYEIFYNSLEKGAVETLHLFEFIANEFFTNDFSRLPLFIQLAMIFDRRIHLREKIILALERGKTVVSDRYFYSTLAYGSAEGLPWQDLLQFHEEILGNFFISPNIAILLDVPVEIGLSRTLLKQGGKKEMFDEKIATIQRQYHALIADPEVVGSTTIIKIGGKDKMANVSRFIWEEVSQLII